MEYLRWGIHEIFEDGKDVKQALWDDLEVAVTHVVHEINVSDISSHGYHRCSSSENHC